MLDGVTKTYYVYKIVVYNCIVADHCMNDFVAVETLQTKGTL